MNAGRGAPRQRIALVGSPNSGKTSLFNALTGLRKRVGNYPGVTVEQVEGAAVLPSKSLTIVDLPGTYSLEPLSPDEHVTVDVLHGRLTGVDRPDGVIVVADATTLERALPAVAEILSVGLPSVVVLTMIDEMATREGRIDIPKLQRSLGVPVVGVVGNRGIGIDDLKHVLDDDGRWHPSLAAIPAGTDEDAVLARFAWADEVHQACLTPPQRRDPRTDKLDRVLLHPVFGLVVFALVMIAFFQAIFTLAAPLQDLFEGGVLQLGEGLRALIPDGLAESLIVDGIVAGVGAVVVFVPQIALLLLLIAIMEGTGYLARAAFLVDRIMGWVGLEGRSFVALLSSFACAVPGIMAARSVPDARTRLSTVLVAPFMTCAARLPVYVLLIAAFVPRETVAGVFGLQGLVMFGLYILGSVTAMVAAAVLKRGLLRGQTLPFYMELPPYRVPMPSVIGDRVWRGVKGFLRKAGTVILAVSILLWALLSFPELDHGAWVDSLGPDAEELAEDDASYATAAVEHSVAARVGHGVEPVLEPLGFDWRIGVGIIASFAAREVIVATLSQVTAFEGGDEDLAGLGARLKAVRGPDGAPAYGLATALSLLVFFAFSLQCVSTLAVMRRETGGWRWPAFGFAYMFGLAYVASLVTFQVATALGG